MYINQNRHIVSHFLFIASISKIASIICNAFSRMLLSKSVNEVAILNNSIEKAGILISVCQLIVIFIAFVYYEKKVLHIKNLIPKAERDEIVILQREMGRDNLSVLTIEQIDCLMRLWGFILVVMQIIYELTTKEYQKLIAYILGIIQSSSEDMEMFINIYNTSHGFKYICMISAIMIGIFVSGLFLNDRIMMTLAFIIIVSFMVMFMFMDPTSLRFFGRDMNIVWVSVFFHVLETLGILVAAIYIRFRYKGM